MQCPVCAAENRQAAKFCNECGAELSLRCSACGTGHRAGQKFCEECGATLGAAPPATAAPVANATVTPPSATELRVASVLFVDLVDFTSLAESRDAEDVRELLSGYFDAARTIVERYGGGIEKFIGDAVMAVWGVPRAREDDAERAVRAALEIIDAVATFGERAEAPGLRARAGVVTGQVAAQTNSGEGIVVGDRVNTAARIQAAAEPGKVLVDDVTRQVSSAAIVYEDAGEHVLKGKGEPVRLWHPTRVVSGVGGKQREASLEAPLVGRDTDLRLIKDLFHSGIEHGVARLVAVSGPAGVGKTRLRWEFDKYTDGLADDFLFHSGRCLPYGDGVAYWALAEMVRQRLGIPEESAFEEAISKLDAGLDRWIVSASDREFLVPRLGALLGVAEPGLAREELFAGWRMFFERLSEHEPVVMVFEDLQWAGDGLLDFIDHLLEWSTQHAIFMLGLSRPEFGEHRKGWPGGRRGATLIHLEPLGEGAMGELLDGLVRGLPAEARTRIVSQAEGIPLYAIETVRALADRGVLVADGDRLALAGELGELDIPASLSSLLAARLDALDPEERELIRTMSVFGGAFPRASAAALAAVPEDRLDPLLESLVRKQVLAIRGDPLSPDRGQYAFAQTLLRTVAYETLSRRERKARHRAAAEHLRAMFPNHGEDVAEVIASHFFDAYTAAGDDDDATELREEALAELRRAARRAETVGAPEAAEHAYRTALELVDNERERAELVEAAGRMAGRAARWEEAVELFERAAAAHEAVGRDQDAARALGLLAKPLRYLGRGAEALERMRAAFTTLDPDQLSPDVADLNLELGGALALGGRPEESEEPLERALTAAEALQLPATLCGALTTTAFRYGFAGRLEQERGLYKTAIEIAERHELSAEKLAAQINLAESLAQTDSPEADEMNVAAMATARRIGDRSFECYCAGNVAYRLLLTGDWVKIDELAEEILRAGEDEPADGHYLHLRLVHLAVLRGDLAAATDHLDRLGGLRGFGDFEANALCQVADAIVALAGDQASAAHEHAVAVLDQTAQLGGCHEAIRCAWLVAVDAALGLELFDPVEDLLEALECRPPGRTPPLLRAELPRIRGLLAAARNRHDTVEADLTAAVRAYEELGYPYQQARAQADLGAWLVARQRRDEALAPLQSASETFARLGAAPAGNRVQQLLAAEGQRVTPSDRAEAATAGL